jgi:hypothetical protein
LLYFAICLLLRCLILSWAPEDETSFGGGLILAIEMLDLVWVDRLGEDKTSFEGGLILLYFCYFMALVLVYFTCVLLLQHLT